MAIRIVSDSTSDLSKEQIARYGITILPLCIIMDGKSYYDYGCVPQPGFWAIAGFSVTLF